MTRPAKLNMNQPDPRLAKVSSKLAQVCALLASGLALLALMGWMSGWLLIAEINTNFIPMAPSTALAFVFLGASLFIHARWPASRLASNFAIAVATLVSAWACLILLQFIGGFDIRLENLLVARPESFRGFPTGRMSPITATGFLLMGLGLLASLPAYAAWKAVPSLGACLATGVTVIGFVALLGYAYGTPLLYGGTIIPVALPTAAALLLAALGLLAAADSRAWPLRLLVGTSVRARLLKAFLPAMLVTVVGEGWLVTVVLPRYGANPALGVSLVALISIALVGTVIMFIAQSSGGKIDIAEAALRSSEEFLRLATSSSNIGLWDWNLRTDEIHFSPIWKRQIGYEEHEIPNRFEEWRNRVHPDDLDRVLDTLRRYLKEPWPDYEEEFRFRHKNGSYLWILAKASLFPDEQGKPCRMIGSHIDITERKRAEERLRLQTTALQAAHNAVVITDRNGIVLSVNPAFTSLTGYTNEEVIGKTPRILRSGQHDQSFYQNLWETILSGNAWHAKTINRRKDGSLYTEEQTITPVRDGRGEITNFIAIKHDITERKRAEDELKARYQELQTLQEISQKVLNSIDVNAGLEAILDQTLSTGGFDIGAIRLFGPDGTPLNIISSGYRKPEGLRMLQDRLGDPGSKVFVPLVIAKRKTFVVEDVQAAEGLQSFKREGVQSAILVPIQTQDNVLGVIQVGNRTPRKFQPTEIRFLETIGSQMGIAIQKARLYEDTKRNLERIRALHEIDKAINSTLDLQAVLDTLLEKIGLFLLYPAMASVRLLNRKTELIEPIACRNIDREEWIAEVRRISNQKNDIARSTIDTKSPAVVSDLRTDPRTQDRQFFRKHGLVSYLGIPLIAKGKPVGVLSIYTKQKHEFSAEEIEVLSTLAGQAAIAIQNSQLYEETKIAKAELESTNQRLERSLKELSGLYTALTPLAPADSITRMMDRIIGRLIETTGADAALIRLREDISGTYPCVAQRGFPDHYLKTVVRPPPAGAVAWVFQNAQPIIASDVAGEDRLKGKIQLQVGLHSCAILPLVVQNEVRGILHLASRELGYFNLEQEHHLMAIARQMGIALENRDLFDKLRASRDELEKANKVKSEFLSVMSHELRTPLTSVMGYTALIQDGLITGAGQVKGLQKVMKHANELLDMINGILQATSLEAEKVQADWNEVDLSEFMADLRASNEVPLDKEVVLTWDCPLDLPVMKTDPTKLKTILQNLISNGIKFTEKGNVTVSAKVIDGRPETGDGETRSSVIRPFLSSRWRTLGSAFPRSHFLSSSRCSARSIVRRPAFMAAWVWGFIS